jgi:hypothetical protein
MSNYTPEAYAESARKYGITPGPWQAETDSLPFVCSEQQIESTFGTICDFYCRNGENYQNIYRFPGGPGNAVAVAQLPNLLIERDALKVENERLRAALDLVQIYGMRIGGMSPDDSLREVVITARAALKGGA